jgi:DTW domain-containing protein
VTTIEPRVACGRCGRPVVVCFCDHITLLPTRHRLLLLQHPRERVKGIGTARLAHLALPGSQLRVGVDFADDPVVRALLAQPPAYVLFPGPQAQAPEQLPRDRPITLVVLDGTWAQARKLLTLNPAIAALPRVAFQPRRPSAYEIRRQPAEFCVSTIEALAEVLERLEPEGPRFDRLLDPFRAMVERQRWFETAVQSRRHRRLGPRPARTGGRPGLGDRLAADWDRLVCVQGEANAWARRAPGHQPPETVHWVAHRLATGERFEAIIAPRRPLAPGTSRHIGLPAEALDAGIGVEAWQRAWASFVRPDDRLIGWGTYYRDLAASEGLSLAAPFQDLRPELSHQLRRRVGTVEAAAEALQVDPDELGIPGRAGRRLALLVSLLRGSRPAARR